jgi:single-strand DNA-binding protein
MQMLDSRGGGQAAPYPDDGYASQAPASAGGAAAAPQQQGAAPQQAAPQAAPAGDFPDFDDDIPF